MFKKLVLGAALVGAGSYMWFSPGIGSYARTAWAEANRYFYGQVPVEFQISRAKQLLAETGPALVKTKRTIAEEEVRIERKNKELVALKDRLEREKTDLLALREKLSSGTEKVALGNITVARKVAEKELVQKFEGAKLTEKKIEAAENTISARHEGLVAAKRKQQQLTELQERFQADIESLEAKLKALQVKEMAKNIKFDDTKMTELKQCLDSISDVLDVEHKLSDTAATEAAGEIEVPVEDVMKQIEKSYGKAPAKGVSL